MLLPAKPSCKASARHPFLAPLWNDDHPDFLRIDATLPSDHHARWFAWLVCRLDLSSFRRAYKGKGSLAYPVELLLAFVLFLYSQGILSPAQWALYARYDDQCKWLLRGLLPSRSRLYAFRDRVEPFLDDWHQQLITFAVLQGITSACRGSLDGTFVAALASRHQLLGGARLDRRLLLLRLLVWLECGPGNASLAERLTLLPEQLLHAVWVWLALLEQGLGAVTLPQGLEEGLALLELLAPEATQSWPPRLPAWVPTTKAGRQRVLRRYESAQQRLLRKRQPYLKKKQLSKKDQETLQRMKVSVSDPEVALGFDKAGTYRPLYNVPLVQATDAPLTLAWDVLARNNDDGLLKPMMEKTREQLGKHLKEVLVDGGFVSVGEVAWCEQEGIVVYAPPKKAEPARAQPVAVESRPEAAAQEPARAVVAQAKADAGAKEEKKLGKEQFRFDAEQDAYYCPEGKRLERISRTVLKRGNGIELPMVVYQASGEECQRCPQQQRCTSSITGRRVKRYQGEEALERLEQRMEEPASKQIYKLRKQSVELGYADLKEHRGLRIFRCFGKKRARAQAGLVILASNGLKIVAALRRREADPTLAQTKPAG